MFFAERGLTAAPIPETKKAKVPDFQIIGSGKVVAFCEVKSPQDIFMERTLDAIRRAEPGRIAGVIECGPKSRQYRCLERAATKAAAQFDAANPDHSVPNILMVVNHDSKSSEEDFREVITGYFGPHPTGQPLRDGIPQIDAYVWFDAKIDPPKIERLFRHGNPLKEDVRSLLSLD